jgi:uncharacterized protein YqeY
VSATLLATLQEGAKEAMRARDEVARDALRMVIAAVKAREIDLDRPATDEDVRELLRNAVKTRSDSAEQFQAAGRDELAAKERREVEVLSRYLPRQLGEDQTRALVQRLIAETGATSKRDLGRVMKAVMAAHRDEVDGKLVQRLAAELLP